MSIFNKKLNNVFFSMLASTKAMILVTLVIGIPLENAHSTPLKALLTEHDPTIHNLAASIRTNTEFHDDTNRTVVRGRVSSLINTGNNITGFNVSVTVKNNSAVSWRDYIISFEFAQHPQFAGTGLDHWESEGYGNFGPQPVLGVNKANLFTVFVTPSKNVVDGPDVPGRHRGALSKGGTDNFTVRFNIDSGGAVLGSELHSFLTDASTFIPGTKNRPDIFWARQSSKGTSDFSQPLASDAVVAPPAPPPARPRTLTQFDEPAAAGAPAPAPTTPATNTGPPTKSSNVSVFPVLSVRVLRSAIAAGQVTLANLTPPKMTFDPLTGSITISDMSISDLQLLAAPSDPRYDNDILNGASINVTGLNHEIALEGNATTHIFGGGSIEIINNNLTFLRGDLLNFGIADLDIDGNLLRNFGIIENLEFPQGLDDSPFLSDISSDLASNPRLSLDFTLEAINQDSLASLISSSLESSNSFTIEVAGEVTVNGIPFPEPVTSKLLTLGLAGLWFNRKRKKSNNHRLKTGGLV